MNIHTKHGVGDYVYGLTRANVDMPAVRCGACEGEKVVDVRGEQFPCPKCQGTGAIVKQASGWIVGESGTIGQIRVLYARADANTYTCDAWEDEPTEGEPYQLVEYMISSTGIGSGTCWREHNLFVTRPLAQAEADRRNDFIRAPRGRHLTPVRPRTGEKHER